MIPLLSYIFLGGKCAQCKEKVSVQYPLVELANALLWTWIFWAVGDAWIAGIYAIALSCMVVIAVVDAKTLTIPDGINGLLLVLGLVLNIYLMNFEFTKSALIAFFAIGGFFWLVATLTHGGIGGGDIKLIAVMGLFFGVSRQIAVVMVGMLMFCIVGIALRKRKMAMGPFLAVAFAGGLVYAEELVRWYCATIEGFLL